ncbi:MAG TPA: glycosyltransferase family 2 protein [Acidobacteriaceae bacterium]|jgi:cellulose synthase/poly-beta-1,6-N-acetylglucosamine synthase-like glycosyltransferase|nr:glycosyltransferase family 2 protein [Acidobacteriaceae bacterium]
MIHSLTISLAVLLVAATLPVTFELAMLTAAFFLPRRKPRPDQIAGRTKLAILVPAHDEETLIARTVGSLRASAGSQTRIVVIAHNCSDRTAERAREAGAEVLVYNDPEARGKGFALSAGFDHVFSQGASAALVVDADSIVSANLVPAVCAAFDNGASAVQCRYEMAAAPGRAKTGLAALAFRGFNYIRARGRGRLGLSSGILGNGFAISQRVFLLAPYRALSVVEDLEYHIHLVLAGYRVDFLEQASVLASFPETKTGETSQRARWEGGRFRAAQQLLLPVGKRLLSGRARLFEPLADLITLPLAYAVFALLVLFLLSLASPLPWARIYSLSALAIIGIHVVTAAFAGEDPRKELGLLLMAPAYILWKLRLVPSLLRGSSRNAAWVRTERAAAARKG